MSLLSILAAAAETPPLSWEGTAEVYSPGQVLKIFTLDVSRFDAR